MVEVTDAMVKAALRKGAPFWRDTVNAEKWARKALEAAAPLIAAQAVASEREACAKVAEARKPLYDLQGQNACAEIASSIRGREV